VEVGHARFDETDLDGSPSEFAEKPSLYRYSDRQTRLSLVYLESMHIVHAKATSSLLRVGKY
jgi:hypothetical protein